MSEGECTADQGCAGFEGAISAPERNGRIVAAAHKLATARRLWLEATARAQELYAAHAAAVRAVEAAAEVCSGARQRLLQMVYDEDDATRQRWAQLDPQGGRSL